MFAHLSDDHARRVVYENARPDCGPGVDVDMEDVTNPRLQKRRERFPSVVPETMRDPLRLDGQEALVEHETLRVQKACRVSVADRLNVEPTRARHLIVLPVYLVDERLQVHGEQRRGAELVA